MNWTFIALGVVALVVGTLALAGIMGSVQSSPCRDVKDTEGGVGPGVGDDGFTRAMELVSRTPLSPGNAVEIFMNGDETYPRLWEDLRAARESITIQMYYCEKGRMADTLREILVERVRAGVTVYFLYDAFGSTLPDEYIESLDAGGVRTAKFRPLRFWTAHKTQHRAHIRVVCIDGRLGYTGGFGIADKWYGNGRDKDQWRDSNVRFSGPAVLQLQSAFVACWTEATGDLLVGDVIFPPEVERHDDGAFCGLMHGAPGVGSSTAERFLALSIAGARTRLFITNSYFVPDVDFRNMLVDAAKRGVDVRVLTAGESSDVKSTLYAGRARYEELLRGGVRIYEYRTTMMHAKTLVVDSQWGAVGSMNADNRSLSFNEETVLLMLGKDAGATLERHFTEDLEHADEVRLDVFLRRGMMERLKEHAAHLPWRVL